MIGRKQEIRLQFLQIIDGVLLVLTFWLAYVVRFTMPEWFEAVPNIPRFDDYRWLLFIIMPFGPITLELQGFYNHPFQKTFWQSIGQLLKAALWLTLILGISVLYFKFESPPRGALVLFGIFASTALLLREKVTRARMRSRARKGYGREVVLLAGTPADVAGFRASLTPEQLLEIDIAGQIDIESQPISELVEMLHRHSVGRVIFPGNHSHVQHLQQAIGACETEGVEAWLVADFIKTSIARPSFDAFGQRPMLVFRTAPAVSWALLLKGVVDRLGALILIILGSPVFIVAALAVRFTSPGPVIFRQVRSGRYGKPFTMYKFRSMATGAEKQRDELLKQNQMSGPVFKVENDPRVTSVGRFLRKTSIDELPQLFNVLRGDMSLVGPRPLPTYEVEQFENTAQRRRLSVKPGLTCLWQISGRSNVKSFEDWVRLDLEYIDNWSLWLDLKILLKTVPVVLFGLGAK